MTELWYDVQGKGSEVVLLHSGLSDSRSWERIRPFLLESHRVLRFDARGFGRSPDPTLEYDRIEDAMAVMDAAKVRSAHLVGNSMGATVARAIALLHPERVRSLTLVGASFPIDGAPEDRVRLSNEWDEARIRGDVDRALAVARAVWISGSSQEGRLRELLVRQRLELPRSIAPPEMIQQVERIAVPVLVVAGEQDDRIVVLASNVLANRIPNAALRVIPDARHHPQEDQPTEFAQIVGDFLADVDRRTHESLPYQPRMPEGRQRLLRTWHERAYQTQRSTLPMRMSFMGLDLQIDEDVFAPHGDHDGDPFHHAVSNEIRPSDRVLDMGTGSGVSGILAARAGAEVVAVDINPKSVECARRNAARNGVADRITFVVGDVFDGVEGDFDLIVFDPPFRWFKPRDMLDMGTADEDYRTLTRFMTEAKRRLRPGGRVLLNFGTSGDIDYLYELIEGIGFTKAVTPYGEATRDGMTAYYYTIRLTA